MPRFALTEGFSLIPEGTHVFQIEEVNYKEDFGKMEVTLRTAKGQKHVERFSLLNQDGDVNEGAMNAFSYFAKCCLNDFNATEIDEQDLVGCFIRCTVEHEEVESKKNPDKFVKFARLTDKEPADGFDEEPVAKKPKNDKPAAAPAKKAKAFDLDSLLG